MRYENINKLQTAVPRSGMHRGVVTEPRTYEERTKRRQWVHPWIRKRDSKRAYFSIINDLRLTDKEDFKKSI